MIAQHRTHLNDPPTMPVEEMRLEALSRTHNLVTRSLPAASSEGNANGTR